MQKRCFQVAESNWFNFSIIGVILANALILALETYESIDRDHGGTLDLLNEIFLGIFVVEIIIRFLAVSANPKRYFSSGWNVFDFVVVAAAFVPGLRENATLLRLARLLRIVRVIRLLPDLRILVVAVGRSIPGVATLFLLTVITLFIYGMVGWVLFGEEAPNEFGDIGEAMLTLFMFLGLEGIQDVVGAGREITPWAIPYYISFAIVASFLLFNLFIGVVINSLEEARALEVEAMAAQEDKDPGAAGDRLLAERVRDLKRLVDELEVEIAKRGP